LRLVFVTDNGFSKKDGSFYFSPPNYAHVKHLKKYFNEFVFVARKDNYDKSNLKIENYKEVHLIAKFNFIKLIYKLTKVIKKADAVICYGINGYFAHEIAKKLNKPIIAYNGGEIYEYLISRGTIKGRLLAPIIRFMERRKFANADYAHFCDDFLIDVYPTNGKILVASGVDIEFNYENLERRITKIRNKKKNDIFRIGLIGHTNNNLKGIGTAIRAISHLDNNYVLEVVGRGNHEKYDELAKNLGVFNQIDFKGTLKAGEEIFSWLDSVDLYIQPSQIEGLPRATIEAMSRGCPIISSNAGGLHKLISEDWRINHKDHGGLAAKICKLTNDFNLMEELAHDNFVKSKKYSSKEREKKYDDFYGEMIRNLK